jgi:hypothetical protein
MTHRLTLILMIIVGAILGAFYPRSAWAVDHSLSGSVQLDYMLVPTARDANARADAFDGFTTEATVKLTADISDHLSAGVKICYGCHGFEADMAYAEYRFGEGFGIRAGRFSPSFGAFNLRHDPANHGLSSKPLPYDMGRMLRMSTWNMSVLPSPFPDNGVEVGGSIWLGSTVQVDYAAYAVSGFKAGNDAVDLDWVQSRSPSLYYVDNNGRPTVGGRLAATARLGSTSDVTLGGSAMYGTFNPGNTLTYAIVGGDLSVRVDKTTVRAEYLVRRTEFDASDPTRFKYSVSLERGNFTTKHGAYLELEQGITPLVAILARVDGMARYGNVESASLLSDGSTVERATLGALLRFEHSLRLKVSTEFWRFSDNDLQGKDKAVSIHAAVVGAF